MWCYSWCFFIFWVTLKLMNSEMCYLIYASPLIEENRNWTWFPVKLMNHLLFDNARMNVWFISYQQIWCILFCSGIFCVHRLCRLYREAFALLCFMWLGILAVLSTQLHRLRCLHPCNAKCYAQPLLSPDNSLIFRFHLHCHLLIHPEVMPPYPWSTYSRTSAGVEMSFLSP